VVYVGQVDAITALTTATPGTQWFTVYLWCPRDVAAQRLVARASSDIAARMRAWDETRPLADADLTLNTAAQAIHDRIQQLD
jgi:guanylate kinase